MSISTTETVRASSLVPYEVAEEEIAFFQKNGFLKLKKVTSAGEVGSIRHQLKELFDRQAGRDEGLFFDFAGSDEQPTRMRLPQLLDVRNFAPDLMKSSFFHNASEIAKQLLGPDALFKADHALLKPPGDGAETPWHQDDAFRDLDYLHNEISIWLALQETDKENGCLGFVPATNDKDVLPHRWVGGDSRIHALECHEGWSKEDIVWCPLLAGDCSIHTNRIVHGAVPTPRRDRAWPMCLCSELPLYEHRPPRNIHGLWKRSSRGLIVGSAGCVEAVSPFMFGAA